MDAVKRIALLFIAWIVCATTAQAERIDIVVPPDSASHTDLARAARYALLQRDASLQINIVSANSDSRADLAIAIGDLLLPWVASSTNHYPATICFYVSSSRFNRVAPSDNRTALFRDQPLQRQLQLATLLLPERARFAMLYGRDGPPPGYAQLSDDSSIDLTAIDISGRSDWPRKISELMVNHDALIAIDDGQLYNRDTIRSVLLTTYRHGRVVIGPSRPFVNAGSLASAYTASDQYLHQLADMVFRFQHSQRLPAPQYPNEFRVAVNRQVAESLDLKVPDEDELTERLRLRDRHLGQECSDGC